VVVFIALMQQPKAEQIGKPHDNKKKRSAGVLFKENTHNTAANNKVEKTNAVPIDFLVSVEI